jgi:hypothetical protein
VRSEASFRQGKWEGNPSNWFDCLKLTDHPRWFFGRWDLENNTSLDSQGWNWIGDSREPLICFTFLTILGMPYRQNFPELCCPHQLHRLYCALWNRRVSMS